MDRDERIEFSRPLTAQENRIRDLMEENAQLKAQLAEVMELLSKMYECTDFNCHHEDEAIGLYRRIEGKGK